jgi:hypothetical protein
MTRTYNLKVRNLDGGIDEWEYIQDVDAEDFYFIPEDDTGYDQSLLDSPKWFLNNIMFKKQMIKFLFG